MYKRQHGDKTVIGNALPRYAYSINLSGDWNNFFLSAFFQGVGKQDWYPSSECIFWGQYNRPFGYMLKAHTGSNVYREELDNWDTAYWPRYSAYQTNESSVNRVLTTPNDRYMQDVSYIRLKNLTIDYNFPKELVNKIGLQALKIYVSGENLLTFSPLKKYAKNYDPEGIYAGDADYGTNKFGSDNFGDGDGYPVMKSYTIGLSITF